MNPASKRTILYVSDGTGITAETLGRGLLSQFEGIGFRQERFPFVDDAIKVAACQSRIREVREQDGVRPIVVMTMINTELGMLLCEEEALYLDLFGVFIAPLEKELGVHSAHTVGRTHGHRGTEYTDRIAAMNFAIAHDDGVTDAGFSEAEAILIGVSRCGKTPTSMYLAIQFGLRAANYPLIPEDFERGGLPERLKPFRDKLFGLSISPEQLHRIRQERRPNSRYAALDNCRMEVAAAENMMQHEGIEYFDMTARSIEEVAVQIIQANNKRKEHRSGQR